VKSQAGEKIYVGESSEVKEGACKIVPAGSTEVGVYRFKGKLYAYQNLCIHQGGPACEGLLMPKVEEVLGPDKSYVQSRFNYDEWHIVCPWHAWEYDVTTGEYVVNRKLHLKKYDVIEEDGKVHVIV
jgi:nitrite reductase (NADH) small subunit